MRFDTYPGNVSTVTVDRVPTSKFTPGQNGYARFASQRRFIPPVLVAGWLQPIDERGSDHPYDGLHLHLGHVGNHRNYVASIVRRDGNAKIAVEYGWKGYETLAGMWDGDGPEFVDGRVYHYEVLWQRDRITTWVGNEAGTWRMDAPIPDHLVIPAGSIGLRLDHLTVHGDVTVREVPA